MTEKQPGWYPVADGLFEAYWEGSTWIEGSKRPIPPGVQVVAPPVPTLIDVEPVSSPTERATSDGVDSFTWRAWIAALSPLTLFVWAVVLAVFPVQATAAQLIAIALTWITCVAAVASAEHALGGWVAVKVSLSPRLLFVPLLAPTIYLASVGPIRPRSPRWPVALAALVVTIGLGAVSSVFWTGEDAGASNATQASSGGGSAAVASPLATLNCASVADHVMRQMNSEIAAASDPNVPLVDSIADNTIIEDHRQFHTSVGRGPITLLKCTGIAVAADGSAISIVMSAYVTRGSEVLRYNFVHR